MTEPLQEFADQVAAAMPQEVLRSEIVRGELILWTRRETLLRLMTFLRDDPRSLFKVLVDVCGVDYPERPERFEVVYNLLSLKHNRRVRVKVATDEENPVPSISGVFSTAGWFERETWDLYGVYFADHPDLRRIPRITASRAIRCARISRSPAMSRCATTRIRSAWSTSR